MAESTTISWADATFNPWVGCSRISPACDNCYAEAYARRTGQAELWQGKRRRTSPANWKKPLKWNKSAAAGEFRECPYCGKREVRKWGASCSACASFVSKPARPRVFCASLADVFDNEVSAVWRSDLFKLIEATPNLDWLLLTKRIGNVTKLTGGVSSWPNVWLGATVVNQEEADRDIPKLLRTPAQVRFLSIEPMLGPIDLYRGGFSFINRLIGPSGSKGGWSRGVDWVIVGGESGSKARPMHPQWVRSIRDQCDGDGVPFHFKQWGEWLSVGQDTGQIAKCYRSNRRARESEDQVMLDDIHGRTCTVAYNVMWADGSTRPFTEPLAFPGGVGAMTMYRVGKAAAGRLIDGQEHNGFPK